MTRPRAGALQELMHAIPEFRSGAINTAVIQLPRLTDS